MDASCEDAYVHCGVSLYRRALTMIDIPGGAYVVDLFSVAGGETHDYLFHGPPVDMTLDGVSLSGPRKGTFAGEDIAFGEKPDDVLPYHVDNKGYQYLYDVRTGTFNGPYAATWSFEDGVEFQARFIPSDDEEFYHTTGYPRPSQKNLPPMPFLVRRNAPDSSSEISRFATVMSYTRSGDEPLIVSAEYLPLTDDSSAGATAIRVRHRYGEDVILSTLSESDFLATVDGRFILQGQYACVTRRNGEPSRVTLAGAVSVTADGETVTSEQSSWTAEIREVYDDRLVLDSELPSEAGGRMMTVNRAPVLSTYRVENLEGDVVGVSPGTWIGRGRVDRYDDASGTIYDSRDIFPLGEKRNRLADITGMKYPGGNRNYYAGSWLVSENGKSSFRLARGGYPGFVLDNGFDLSAVPKELPVGSTFLLYDVGPGDTVHVLNYSQTVIDAK